MLNTFTRNEIVENMKHWRKGAKWVLTLLDLEAEEEDPNIRRFVNEFITKYEEK